MSSAALRIVIAGVVMRAVGGLTLFWISASGSPLLAHLHTGDGFWDLAPDARAYFHSASSAIDHGLSSVPPDTVSPTYVRTLAVWMSIAGVSPLAGFLLNLVCYVLTCGFIFAAYRAVPTPWRMRALVYSLGAITFSPALLVFGTQALKDTLVVLLTVVAAIGVSELSIALAHRARWSVLRGLLGVGLIASAMLVVSGIRAYYAFVIWTCAGIALLASIMMARNVSPWRTGVAAAVTLVVAWTAFVVGAGPAARPYQRLLALEPGAASAAQLVMTARSSYEGAGGNTNFAATDVDAAALLEQVRARSLAEHAHALRVGLAALFVPMTLLKALSIVQFDGGRNMLALADVDTAFLTLTLVAGTWMTARTWRLMRQNTPSLLFAIGVAVALTLLTAYVVTNYGTMVRLRIMLAIPIWTMPLALRLVRDDDRAEGESRWRRGRLGRD